MALQSSKIHLRTITIGAGAVVLAVIGYYFLMKSDSRKKSKKKVHQTKNENQHQPLLNNDNDETASDCYKRISLKEVKETDRNEIKLICDLYSENTSFDNLSKNSSTSLDTITATKPYNKTQSLGNDETIVLNNNNNNDEINSLQLPELLTNQIENENNNNNNKMIITTTNINVESNKEVIIMWKVTRKLFSLYLLNG